MKPKFPLFPSLTSLVLFFSLPAFADDTPVAGNLNYTGWGKFGEGIDMGANSETSFNWLGSKTTGFDIVEAQGVFLWRDTIVTSPASSKNKMQLDGANALSLYKSTGSAGIVLAPETGKITLPAGTGSATGSGIYFGSNANATLSAASDGTAIFPDQVSFQNGLQLTNGIFSVTSTTASSSSSTGALTVSGGIGVASDSYISDIRIGIGSNSGGIQRKNSMAVGNGALANNISGRSNTALGKDALTMNQSGSYNTATGYGALKNNISGQESSAYGNLSLTSNTTGSSNSAYGSSSLTNNTTGDLNCAFGDRSLAGNTNGIGNTASGMNSLAVNTSGSYNSAFGIASLQSSTLGVRNSASGCGALALNNTGDDNSALGYMALGFNVAGSLNVAMGVNAGSRKADGTPLGSVTKGVFIGANATGCSNGDQNTIVIGPSAVGEGSNTTVIGNDATISTRLRGETKLQALRVSGAVIMEQPQGDISMGNYQ